MKRTRIPLAQTIRLLCQAGFIASLPATPCDAALVPISGNGVFLGAISGDGRVVTGQAQSANGIEAFVWDPVQGLQFLGDLPGGAFNSVGLGLSWDGSVIVGRGANELSSFVPVRWTMATGPVSLGSLPGEPFPIGVATGLSSDGNVIVGQTSLGNGGVAFRWTQATGMQSLGSPQGANVRFGTAFSVSDDGQTVTGRNQYTDGSREAFFWTDTEGMVTLGDFPGGAFNSTGRAISADGTVVVGTGTISNSTGDTAFRWTKETGMTSLGLLPGWTTSQAIDVSADGRLIVGFGTSNGITSPLIWTLENGMEDFRRYLAERGIDQTDWTISSVIGVSADGNTFTGMGTYQGQSAGYWITVPEPGTCALITFGILTALLLRRRKAK